jgi:hypothetical protein
MPTAALTLSCDFNVDNYPQSDWLRVSPGQTVSTGYFIRSGDHVLSVMAKGIEGGCNTGILNSWGGTVRLDSVDIVGPAPQPVPDDVGPAPKPFHHHPASGGTTAPLSSSRTTASG